MTKENKRVDAYIEKSAAFAHPVLHHLRALVHKACPDAEETIKWGFPCFDYKGIMCSMAAFKTHCAFGFWKAALMKDPVLAENAQAETAMGNLGKITGLQDLPPDKVLLGWIKEAAMLNEKGIKLPAKPKKEVAPVATPGDLAAALKQNKKAAATYEGFSNSNRKEYVQWITEAKTAGTRLKRIATAVEWMAEGKIRNWKYVKK